ncbi:GAF and ANTAR domain-containing protein [Mycobacterium sp. NPDC050551]|uniref:GAF and ANTAR domain-containing protein n=1 Tax=Mycobacterium sp. NPDC050551 TaxID=3155407 RepID=UPI003421792E
MSAASQEKIAQQLAEVTRELGRISGADAAAVLHDLAAGAVESLPDATYAGITEAHRDGKVRNVAGTHSVATLLDQIQQQHRQGPCLAAAWENHTVRVDDLARETRWPDYCREVLAQSDVRSVLSFELFTGPKLSGALNFYAVEPNAFTPQGVEIGLIFATHTAKGIIMERFDVDAAHAFDLLKRLSQDTNTPLVEVAGQLVARNHPVR